MSEWTQPDRRIGMFSAIAVVTIIAVYIILAAVTLVVMMAAVCAYAPPDRKTYALAALAFMIIFATPTCSVHFAALTVVRRIDPKLTSEPIRHSRIAR